MNIKLNQKQLDWLEKNNISFSSNISSSRLKIGDEINFKDGLSLEPYVGFHAGNNLCSMGYMSYSTSKVPLDITIGRYCSLSWGLDFPSYAHPHQSLSTSAFTFYRKMDLVLRVLKDKSHETNSAINWCHAPQKAPAEIGSDVWIGQFASIMSGVRVGNGSIIAAHSVVTKDVEPYSVVGGNPARHIKYRFDLDLCAALQDSNWWQYDFFDFKDLTLSNPYIFLEEFNKRRLDLEPYNPKLIDISIISEIL